MLWGLGALGRLGLSSIWRLVVKRESRLKCSNESEADEGEDEG